MVHVWHVHAHVDVQFVRSMFVYVAEHSMHTQFT